MSLRALRLCWPQVFLFALCLFLFVAQAISAGAAKAQNQVGGITPNFAIIGYSPDGRYFAYEEFGQKVKSEKYFATIYVRDIVEDRWILGTPETVESFDGESGIGPLRADVLARVQGILTDLDIGVPGVILALNADGVADRAGNQLSFGVMLSDMSSDVAGAYDLSLETFGALPSVDCASETDAQILGFALNMENFGGTLPLHRDGILSRARGCPVGYEIKAAINPWGASDISRGVVIVAITTHSEEGPSRTFFPVPMGLGLGRLN